MAWDWILPGLPASGFPLPAQPPRATKTIFSKSSPTVLLFCLPMSLEFSLSRRWDPNLLFTVASQAFHHLCSPFLSGLNSTTAPPTPPLKFTPSTKQDVPFLLSRLHPAVLSAQIFSPFSPSALPVNSYSAPTRSKVQRPASRGLSPCSGAITHISP